MSGGAPLSPDLQSFMEAVLCCPIQQAYGMTEVCGPAVITELDDHSTDGNIIILLDLPAFKIIIFRQYWCPIAALRY